MPSSSSILATTTSGASPLHFVHCEAKCYTPPQPLQPSPLLPQHLFLLLLLIHHQSHFCIHLPPHHPYPHLKPINYASNVWAVTETSPLSVHGDLTSNSPILLLNLPHLLPFSHHMAWLLWLHLSPPPLQRNPPLAYCTPKHTQLTHLQSPILPPTLLLLIPHHHLRSNLHLHLHPSLHAAHGGTQAHAPGAATAMPCSSILSA
nr:hypothetical transcript [Hymenolepis microstoma]